MNAITSSSPVWLAAGALLAEQGTEFFSRWKKAAASFGADDIHDLRVASRRLREGLIFFAPCFPENEFAAIEKKVKKLTRILGELRNTDEALLFFGNLSHEGGEGSGEAAKLVASLEQERGERERELHRDLRALDPAPLRAAFRRARRHPRIFGGGLLDTLGPFGDFARAGIELRERPMTDLIPCALEEEAAKEQHRLRIAVKQLRYRLEIIKPLLHPVFTPLHATLKRYQDLLGELHDLDVFSGMVTDRVADQTGRQALLTRLALRRHQLHQAFLKALQEEPLATIGERARKVL